MIEDADADGNGQIDFMEFTQMILKRQKQEEQEDTLQDSFKLFDRNNDGQITADDLYETLSKLGENISKEDIEEMIRTIDIDGDMAINYDEFIKMMMKTQVPAPNKK